MAYTSKTNEDAIANVEAKLPNLRRNKDGSINGNALHSMEMGARRTFHRNGADWNTACDMSRDLMRSLVKPAAKSEAKAIAPKLPSYEEALRCPVKARALFDASKGGDVRGITEDHRFALARVFASAEKDDADAALDDFNYVGSRHHY